jgi:phage regulator Rha-like protein
MKTIKELKEDIQYQLCKSAIDKFSDYPAFLANIYTAILDKNNLTIGELFLSKNELPIVTCRHEIHYILYTLFAKKKDDYKPDRKITLSLAEIGRLTGKNHSSVLNSIRVIQNEFDTKKNYKNDFMNFYNNLSSLLT